MIDRGCSICLIVYHMISDSTPKKICKKCGGPVMYWDADFVNNLPNHEKVKHDFMWSSNNPTPEDIDPNYEPENS